MGITSIENWLVLGAAVLTAAAVSILYWLLSRSGK